MPKWKAGAKEFTVSVTYHEVRGYAATIPKPVIAHLAEPEYITYAIRGRKVEVRAGTKLPAHPKTNGRKEA